MSPSSTVYGGQHDTKYVTFELLLHAAFVADEIWGFMLEPARMSPSSTVHGGHNDTKYATLELLLHAALAADEN